MVFLLRRRIGRRRRSAERLAQLLVELDRSAGAARMPLRRSPRLSVGVGRFS